MSSSVCESLDPARGRSPRRARSRLRTVTVGFLAEAIAAGEAAANPDACGYTARYEPVRVIAWVARMGFPRRDRGARRSRCPRASPTTSNEEIARNPHAPDGIRPVL